MSNEYISLHFAQSRTSVSRTPLRRLPGQDLRGTRRPGVILVSDHVLGPHVVRRSHEDLAGKLLTSHTVVHRLIAIALVPAILRLVFREPASTLLDRRAQESAYIVDSGTIEGRGVPLEAFHATYLAHDRLDELTDRHTFRHRVRVDDDVREQTVFIKGHVFLGKNHSDDAFLRMPALYFVAYIRDSS